MCTRCFVTVSKTGGQASQGIGNTFIKDSKSTEGYEVPAPATLLSLWECTNGCLPTSARTDSVGEGSRGNFVKSLMRDQGWRKKKIKARVLKQIDLKYNKKQFGLSAHLCF